MNIQDKIKTVIILYNLTTAVVLLFLCVNGCTKTMRSRSLIKIIDDVQLAVVSRRSTDDQHVADSGRRMGYMFPTPESLQVKMKNFGTMLSVWLRLHTNIETAQGKNELRASRT